MATRLITRSKLLKRLQALHISLVNTSRKIGNVPKGVLICLAPYSIFHNNARDNLDNFDLKLKDACERGEAAVIELMEFLKTNIINISKEYIQCLKIEIKIIDEAVKAGAASRKWDALPEFRTKAADLNEQWQIFLTIVNILGNLSENPSLRYIVHKEKQFKLLFQKQKELEEIINFQLEEIEKLEQLLLEKSLASIIGNGL